MLKEYEEKRDFTTTPEPGPHHQPGGEGPLVFVVQKHAARRVHYDFRLELDGVLKSWSIPNGPSLDPEIKRLAVMVEDHPLDYGSFEGVIPKGEYGAGQVIVWDRGTYSPDEGGRLLFKDRTEAQEEVRGDLAKGKLSIRLRGHKLKGSWTLVKMQRGKDNWLFIKHRDELAQPNGQFADDSSVISGLGIPDLKAGRLPGRHQAVRFGLSDLPGARRSPFPTSLAPMLAWPASAPFSSPDWLFEPKLDGFRILAFVHEGQVKLLSRRGLDVTQEYPILLEGLSKQPAEELILDGEIVALDDNGRPCFQCLQQHRRLREKGEVSALPIVYYVFDILNLDGYDLRDVALHQRKELLESVVISSEHVRLVDHIREDGLSLYEATVSFGMEGIVAKRLDSVYESGQRSRSWLKIKAVLSDEFVVGGYSQGTGNRTNVFGALLLGHYDDEGHLRYVGHVGTGFDESTLTDLRERLDLIKANRCPFAEMPPLNATTTWVRPELVVEVKFSQWTENRYLRAPVFLRLRDDKPPAEVHRVEFASPPHSEPTKDDLRSPLVGAVENVLKQLEDHRDGFVLQVERDRITVANLDKVLWPAVDDRPPLTKRDFLAYLAKVAPYILPQLRDRPLTLIRYPDGIYGEHFYQKHWSGPLPHFVESVHLSEHDKTAQEYLLCNNLATLLWLGQMADVEFHTWFSRMSPEPDRDDVSGLSGGQDERAELLSDYPDFIIFDLDPYIYSGNEPQGAEPELNRRGFAKTCEVALWLKDILDSLSLSSLVKTSGRTGLHIYVPILRQLNHDAVRSAAQTLGRFLLQRHPQEITMDWAVERRTGKVFLDCNQNVRGKTLVAAYSPRAAPEATVSMPLRWDEIGKVYPTDFTILTAPGRLSEVGDLWASILESKNDLRSLLKNGGV